MLEYSSSVMDVALHLSHVTSLLCRPKKTLWKEAIATILGVGICSYGFMELLHNQDEPLLGILLLLPLHVLRTSQQKLRSGWTGELTGMFFQDANSRFTA